MKEKPVFSETCLDAGWLYWPRCQKWADPGSPQGQRNSDENNRGVRDPHLVANCKPNLNEAVICLRIFVNCNLHHKVHTYFTTTLSQDFKMRVKLHKGREWNYEITPDLLMLRRQKIWCWKKWKNWQQRMNPSILITIFSVVSNFDCFLLRSLVTQLFRCLRVSVCRQGAEIICRLVFPLFRSLLLADCATQLRFR